MEQCQVGSLTGAVAKKMAGQNKLMDELAPDRKASEHTSRVNSKTGKHTPGTSSVQEERQSVLKGWN